MKKSLADLPPDDPAVIDARLVELEKKMDRLKTMYESYFMGMERQAPNTPRMELNRLVLEAQQVNIRKAAQRFRFRTLMQKWSLHITYWNRTMREIEAGTYRRDLARAARHLADRGVAISEQEAIAIGIPAGRARAFAAQHNRRLAVRGILEAKTLTGDDSGPGAAGASPDSSPEPPAPARPVPAARTAATPAQIPTRLDSSPEVIPGMSESAVVALHKRYQDAQKQAADPKGPLGLSQLKDLLRRQAPKIMQDHMAFGVVFDVAVKEGKVVLRAKPLK